MQKSAETSTRPQGGPSALSKRQLSEVHGGAVVDGESTDVKFNEKEAQTGWTIPLPD